MPDVTTQYTNPSLAQQYTQAQLRSQVNSLQAMLARQRLEQEQRALQQYQRQMQEFQKSQEKIQQLKKSLTAKREYGGDYIWKKKGKDFERPAKEQIDYLKSRGYRMRETASEVKFWKPRDTFGSGLYSTKVGGKEYITSDAMAIKEVAERVAKGEVIMKTMQGNIVVPGSVYRAIEKGEPVYMNEKGEYTTTPPTMPGISPSGSYYEGVTGPTAPSGTQYTIGRQGFTFQNIIPAFQDFPKEAPAYSLIPIESATPEQIKSMQLGKSIRLSPEEAAKREGTWGVNIKEIPKSTAWGKESVVDKWITGTAIPYVEGTIIPMAKQAYGIESAMFKSTPVGSWLASEGTSKAIMYVPEQIKQANIDYYNKLAKSNFNLQLQKFSQEHLKLRTQEGTFGQRIDVAGLPDILTSGKAQAGIVGAGEVTAAYLAGGPWLGAAVLAPQVKPLIEPLRTMETTPYTNKFIESKLGWTRPAIAAVAGMAPTTPEAVGGYWLLGKALQLPEALGATEKIGKLIRGSLFSGLGGVGEATATTPKERWQAGLFLGGGVLEAGSAFGGPAIRTLEIPTKTGKEPIKVKLFGLETTKGGGLIFGTKIPTVELKGWQKLIPYRLGVPDILGTLKEMPSGKDVKLGSALETKAIQEALQKGTEKEITTRAKEIIKPFQYVLGKTMETKSGFINEAHLTEATERLPEQGVNVFLKLGKEHNGILFGSKSRAFQLAQEYNIGGETFKLIKVPRDVELRFDKLKEDELSKVTQIAINKLKSLGTVEQGGTKFELGTAREIKDTPNAIEAKINGVWEKVAELKGKEQSPIEEQVPEYVVGLKKVGTPFKTKEGTMATTLAEEARGVSQGVLRLKIDKDTGLLDIYPSPKRVKDIGSVSVTLRSLAESKKLPSAKAAIYKRIEKIESLFPEKLVREQVQKVLTEPERVVIADFSKTPSKEYRGYGVPLSSLSVITPSISTISISPSKSVSLGISPSPRISPSRSPYLSPSPSLIPSPSRSPSISPSRSVSPSISPSISPSPSPSQIGRAHV